MAGLLNEMKALILVGGLGSRLQPITFTTPKPLLPFVNRPMLEHQIEALAKAGVKHVILAMNYKYRRIISSVEGFAKKYETVITYSLESEPLGTAGPISLARKYLEGGSFFVLNSDIICDFPLKELLDFHRKRGALGTVLATNVEDPRKFGVIKTRAEDPFLIEQFVEKPQVYVGNRINAGIYVFEPRVLEYLETRPSSIEKEVFPVLASMNHLCVFDLVGFWMDVGTPAGYLEAQRLYLDREPGPPRFGRDVKRDEDAEIGIYVTLGNDVSIGRGAKLENCVIFDNTRIGNGVQIMNSIVGRECSLEGKVVLNNSVLGDKTRININKE